MFRAGCLLLLLLSYSVMSFAGDKATVDILLDSLDGVLARRQVILARKQSVINDLRHGAVGLATDEARTVKYEQLFTEYLHFDGDSALAYAERAEQMALRTQRPELVLSARFCLLRAYTRQGLMGKGYETILSIGSIKNVMPVYHEQYADLLIDYALRASSSGNLDYTTPTIDATKAWKDYSPYLSKESSEYCFYKSMCTKFCDVNLIEHQLASLPKPSFQAADLFFALAVEYNRKGKTEDFYKNLISSAINDVLLANTEASSMLYLLQTPLLEKDLKRSYAYIQICADNVRRYNDIQRGLEVVEIQSRINKQFNESRTRRMATIVIIAVLFFVALTISLIESLQLRARNMKIKLSLEALRELHRKQEELVKQQRVLGDKLKEANLRLSDRLYIYRKDFLNVYNLVSTYITYEKTARRELANLLRTNSIRSAMNKLESNTYTDDQLKLFYQSFDNALLSMYPDFVHRLNTIFTSDNQVDETVKSLTTPLRICALIMLGINDCVGIAEFLHLSSQTVYNYRLKMRRNSINEKKFDELVGKLYSPIDSSSYESAT